MASNNWIISVQGSYHQGDARFGSTAGRQCTCCSLFSIVFTLVKSPGQWNTHDLDFIVERGDKIYKNLNTNNYLMLTELPRETSLFNAIINVAYLENKFGLISGQSLNSFIFWIEINYY